MKKIIVSFSEKKELTTVIAKTSEKSFEFGLLVALQKKLMGRSWKGATSRK